MVHLFHVGLLVAVVVVGVKGFGFFRRRKGILRYPFLYLLATVFFMVLYHWFARDFYQSTAALEGQARGLRDHLAQDVRQVAEAIVEAVQKDEPNDTIDKIRVDNLQANVDSIEVWLTYHREPHYRSFARSWNRLHWVIGSGEVKTSGTGLVVPLQIEDQFSGAFLSKLHFHGAQRAGDEKVWGPFKGRVRRDSSVENLSQPGWADGELNLGADVVERMRDYSALSRGSTEADLVGFDGWLRFSYLSMVTITTLGFGDIVPISATARLLVGLEAMTGVVLAGLFLNDAARPR